MNSNKDGIYNKYDSAYNQYITNKYNGDAQKKTNDIKKTSPKKMIDLFKNLHVSQKNTSLFTSDKLLNGNCPPYINKENTLRIEMKQFDNTNKKSKEVLANEFYNISCHKKSTNTINQTSIVNTSCYFSTSTDSKIDMQKINVNKIDDIDDVILIHNIEFRNNLYQKLRSFINKNTNNKKDILTILSTMNFKLLLKSISAYLRKTDKYIVANINEQTGTSTAIEIILKNEKMGMNIAFKIFYNIEKELQKQIYINNCDLSKLEKNINEAPGKYIDPEIEIIDVNDMYA